MAKEYTQQQVDAFAAIATANGIEKPTTQEIEEIGRAVDGVKSRRTIDANRQKMREQAAADASAPPRVFRGPSAQF